MLKKSALFLTLLAGLLSPPGTNADVWAHYSFDTDLADASPNGNDGTLTDTGTVGNSFVTNNAGDFVFGGGAMEFSSDRDYVAIPSKTFGTGSPYSIAFWAKKAPGDTGDPALWDMVIGERGNTNFFIALNDASGSGNRTGLRWRSNTNAGGTRQVDFTSASDSDWHHYAITADVSGNLSFYLDGVFQETIPNVSTGIILDTIGEAYDTGRDFDFHGHLDELWIFDEPLTAGRVQNLYNSNDPDATVPAELLHYRFDGDFTDSSGQANNGTANGTAAISSEAADIASGSGALGLDGADSSYVSLSSPLTFALDDAWTAMFWAKRGELGGQKGMVMGTRSNTSDFIWLNDNFTGFRFRSSNATTHDFSVAQDLTLHHYALVADGGGNLTLFLDGEEVQSKSGNTSFSINTVGNAYNTLSYAFQGSLDEVHVFSVALSETEIVQIYEEEKPGVSVPVTRIRAFILSGQSNADGRGNSASLPANLSGPQSDVDLFYRTETDNGGLTLLRPGLSETSGFGPEITLGRRLTDIFGHDGTTRVAIIKYANGGTNLANQWKAGGDATTTGDGPEYVTLQETVTDGLAALAAKYPAATIEIEGMVWMQGESDIQQSVEANYEANLTAFVSDIRSTYGGDLPFIVIRLSSGQTTLNAGGLATVRAAQTAVAAADPRVGLIDSDSFGMKADELHFNESGLQQMGAESAVEMVYFRWLLDSFPAGVVDSGQATGDGDNDGDSRSNREEFIGGTDPNDPASVLSASLLFSGPEQLEITYPAAADRDFAVEYLTPANTWEEVLAPRAGNGGEDSRSFPSSGARNFYRVRAQLP